MLSGWLFGKDPLLVLGRHSVFAAQRGVAGGCRGAAVGCGRSFCVGGATGQNERFESIREAISPHTCDRGAPGTIEGVRGLRPCESRSARSGTLSVCAGGTSRAVRECACTRRACPSVLKDTSGRRRRSRCRVTSPRAPVIIARCRSRARIRAEAAAAASAGTVALGLGQESGSRTPAVPTSCTLGSLPVLGNLPGFLGDVPALFSTRDRGVRVLRAPKRRRRRERETARVVLRSGGGGSRGAAGGGGSRPDG